MATYIHQLADWPKFTRDDRALATLLAKVRNRQGRLVGRMEALGFPLRSEAVLQTLTQDVVKSSEIEGEILDADQVRSSLASRLGIDIGALTPADRNVEGVVEMMLDATQKYDSPLTAERGPDCARSRSVPGAMTNPGRCGLSQDRSEKSVFTTRLRRLRTSPPR